MQCLLDGIMRGIMPIQCILQGVLYTIYTQLGKTTETLKLLLCRSQVFATKETEVFKVFRVKSFECRLRLISRRLLRPFEGGGLFIKIVKMCVCNSSNRSETFPTVWRSAELLAPTRSVPHRLAIWLFGQLSALSKHSGQVSALFGEQPSSTSVSGLAL